MKRILQKFPFQRSIFIPLVNLAKVLSHKEQLLARMGHHKAVRSAQIFCFLFQSFSWHFPHHGAFSVNHLVMGKYQDKVFTVGIEHGKGKPAVIIFPEIGIAAHIVGEVIHPAHIPLVVKAKTAVLWIAGDHGPCCGLLCDQHSAVFASLKYAV